MWRQTLPFLLLLLPLFSPATPPPPLTPATIQSPAQTLRSRRSKRDPPSRGQWERAIAESSTFYEGARAAMAASSVSASAAYTSSTNEA